MSGFWKAEYIKGPARRLKRFLFIRNDGSIDINVLGLGNVKSSAVEFNANELVKLPGIPLPKRNSLIIRPIIGSAGTFYVGGEDVSVDNGLPLGNLEYFSIDISENADLWGIADVSGEIRILEISEVPS